MKSGSRRELVVISIISFLLVLSFQNCEQQMAMDLESMQNKSTSNPPPNNHIGPISLPELMQKCDDAERSNTLKQVEVDVNFDSLPNSASGGGTQYCLEPTPKVDEGEQKYISYSMQNKNFDLPPNSKICKMDFMFEDQYFKYDDHFVFSFDNRVLASNSKGLMQYLKKEPALDLNGREIENKSFNWSLLRNRSWGDNGNESDYFYCLGKDLSGTFCSWPVTDTAGVIQLEYPQSLLMQIANQKASTSHDFNFVVTGDNNPGTDCQHTPISFKVKVSYITK